MDKYDVIVVGAGPAGSVTARFAAENGAKVLILERDREPGIPVRCAEGVSKKGIEPFIELDDRWIATTINKAKLVSPSGESLVMNNDTGFVLERRLFDTALCDLACKYGAVLLTKANVTGLYFENDRIAGVKYTSFGEEKIVKGDIIIGADGVESRVGRWAGLKTDVSLQDIDTCVQYTLTDIEVADDTCDFYFGEKIAPGGYVWVFPKSKSTANVGIGIAGNMAKDKSPKEYLDEFIEKKFPNAKKSYTVCGGVPTAATLKEIVADNIMLVGDAARQVNPISGGGIVQAMIAGSIAGKVAAEAVKKQRFDKKFLKKYRKEWDKRLGNTQKTMFKMKDKFLYMKDEKLDSIVENCSKIPPEKFTTATLFKEAIKEDPKLVMEIAKAFIVSKVKK